MHEPGEEKHLKSVTPKPVDAIAGLHPQIRSRAKLDWLNQSSLTTDRFV
jgi:hypothetical protein